MPTRPQQWRRSCSTTRNPDQALGQDSSIASATFPTGLAALALKHLAETMHWHNDPPAEPEARDLSSSHEVVRQAATDAQQLPPARSTVIVRGSSFKVDSGFMTVNPPRDARAHRGCADPDSPDAPNAGSRSRTRPSPGRSTSTAGLWQSKLPDLLPDFVPESLPPER